MIFWVWLASQAALGLAVTALVATSWMSVCNYRTHTDLMKVIEQVRHRPMSGPQIIAALNAVPYNTHMRTLMLFRDPWVLYDPMVKDAIDNPRTEVLVRGEVTIEGEPPPRMN